MVIDFIWKKSINLRETQGVLIHVITTNMNFKKNSGEGVLLFRPIDSYKA